MTTVEVKNEPLTYERERLDGVSFFRDLLDAEAKGDRYALERLGRHRVEMDVVREGRNRASRAAMRAGGFETRTEPSRTERTVRG
jgi:hypothetical protein